MKLAMGFLLLVSSASGASGVPGNGAQQLSMIMSGAQQQLSRAQRHQGKLVEKTRTSVEKNLRAEAESITEEFTEYVAEVRSSEMVLEKAVNTTEAALKVEKGKHKPGDWDRKASMDRARLGADVGSAKQVLMHEEHQDKRALRKAEHVAEDLIGGEVDKLGRKLGDLGSIAADVDKQLEEHIKMATEQVLRDNQTFTSPQADYNASGPTHLSELNQGLGKAETASAAGAAGANKRLNDFLTRVSGEIAKMSDETLSDMSHKEKQEDAKVFGDVAAPAAKASKSTPAVAKTQQKPKAELKASKKAPAVAKTLHKPKAEPKVAKTQQKPKVEPAFGAYMWGKARK